MGTVTGDLASRRLEGEQVMLQGPVPCRYPHESLSVHSQSLKSFWDDRNGASGKGNKYGVVDLRSRLGDNCPMSSS